MINETLSLDSTLESPTKPHQENPSSQNKAIFLVHYMKDKQNFNKKKENINDDEKPKQNGPNLKKIGNIKKFHNNMLDFDIVLSTLFGNEKKDSNALFRKKRSIKKAGKKKLFFLKRNRKRKEIINKSK
jgi:hypothetical protein